MYTTTDPKLIEQEVAEAREIVEKLSGEEHVLNQAGLDRLAAAKATIAMYADLVDEDGHVAEYRHVMVTKAYAARAKAESGIEYPADWILDEDV